MVEIAFSLAIIGFALIAIIGVLPAGMTVQRDNREQTVINLDAAFLMDAIRNGAQGQNDLTNYILSITNISTPYSPSGVQTGASIPVSYGPAQLTNGAIIVGLLSTPKYYVSNPSQGFISNSVTACFRAINGPAVDQGSSPTARISLLSISSRSR